jgi:hypothetical protein
MSLGGTPFDRGSYRRRIELLDSSLSVIDVLCDYSDSESLDCVESARFELLRQGGCGAGQFALNDRFPGEYEGFSIGQYVRCSWAEGEEPVYLGKVEEIISDAPSGLSLRTFGPVGQLTELQAGGFDSEDLALPHLFAASSDRFIYDPDINLQSYDFVDTVPGLIQKLYDRYIAPRTNIGLGTISATAPVPFGSSVFRGQENVSQIIRTAAVQQLGASYGVDANNELFFVDRNLTELHTFQEAQHLSKLSKNVDRDLLYNRLILTGDYSYFPNLPTKFYRWVSAHASLSSIAAYGSKKIVLYVPWIRTWQDANSFAEGFFEAYGEPRVRFSATTIPQGAIMRPWDGTVGLLNRAGSDLVRAERFDRIEVVFDRAPYFSFTTGPEDLQWPVTPEPNRWEIQGGGDGDDGLSDLLSSSSSASSEDSASSGRSDFVPCPPGCVKVLADLIVRCSDNQLVVEKQLVCVVCGQDTLGNYPCRCVSNECD